MLFGAMHVIAFLLGGVLFWMFLHSETVTPWEPPDEEEGGGGGGNDRLKEPPKPPRPGGIPLPDASSRASASAAPAGWPTATASSAAATPPPGRACPSGRADARTQRFQRGGGNGTPYSGTWPVNHRWTS